MSEVDRGAAGIALSLLDDGAHAFQRLFDDSDPESLHDLRVAVRRLRVHLRAYRAWLAPAVSRGLRRRLKHLAKATNPARDTQVQLNWLRQQQQQQRADSGRNVRVAIDMLIRDRTRLYRAQQRKVLKRVRATFPQLESRLRLQLLKVQVNAKGAAPRLGEVTADAIRRRARSLRNKLRAIHSVEDTTAIHAARIAGKKLRYLMQPFAREVAGGSRCLARLKALQDGLGDIHDRGVFAEHLGASVGLAGNKSTVATGIAILQKHIRAETKILYRQTRRLFLDRRIETGFATHMQFAQRLAVTGRAKK